MKKLVSRGNVAVQLVNIGEGDECLMALQVHRVEVQITLAVVEKYDK